MTSGAITRVVSDNDPTLAMVGGAPGETVLAPNFFLNENGQVAFETVDANAARGVSFSSIGFGPGTAWSSVNVSNCGTIYLSSPPPAARLTKIAAPGDMSPNSTTPFSCVTLNTGMPTPLNRSGQLVFSNQSLVPNLSLCFLGCLPSGTSGLDGVFLYSPGTTNSISEIAAANETLPGETQQTTFVPDIPVSLNSIGQVAFGAQIGVPASGFQGFFIRKAGDTSQKVVSSGDTVPGSTATFSAPTYITGLDDVGNLTFRASTSTAADGIFSAPAGNSIQTIALDGGAAPALTGGTFELDLPFPTTGQPLGIFLTPFPSEIVLANSESDVAFRSVIVAGNTDSGYFRRLQRGIGLQAVAFQGQSVPGGGTFATIGFPGSAGNDFALGPDGALAFVASFISDSGGKRGLFVVRPDGIIARIFVTGDTAPGGGVLNSVTLSHGLAAGEAGKFAFLAGIQGGTVRQAIFITAIPSGTANTTTALSSSQISSVFGHQVTLTANVSSAVSGVLSGNVSFFDNGVLLGSGVVGTGQATLNISSLLTGSHSIVAQYSGDTNFAPSNSSTFAETINPRSTATALISSLSPAVGGQSVTFTASVTTSAGGAPTGTVTFLDGSTSIGTGTLNGSALATLITSALTVASHSIAARYEGDVNSVTSTSAALNEAVNVAGFAPPPTNSIVTAGQSVVIPLTLYGASGSNLSFMLSCSGLPVGASCAFGSNPVSPAAPPNGTTVQLTLSTTVTAATLPAEPRGWPWPLGVVGFATGVFAWVLRGAAKPPMAARQQLAFGICLATFAVALVMLGCSTSNSSPGSGSSGTPRGPATFTVTGTSSTTSVTTVVNVTVR